jgi:F-type H+-transporting ATPase subunit delta
MAPRDPLIVGYAQALFSVAEAEGALSDVEDELFRFSKIAQSDAKLREALTDLAIPVENKKAMLFDLLGGRVHPQTVNLLGFIVEQGRARQLTDIVAGLVDLAAERRNSAFAEVRSAVPLTDPQKERLQAALSKAMGRRVELKILVDPSVVGGVIARVGDQIFDGTVRTRLREAKEQLGSV